MNRLTPLIIRKTSGTMPVRGRWENLPERDAETDPLADLKLFATGWLAGLVFFGTYLS